MGDWSGHGTRAHSTADARTELCDMALPSSGQDGLDESHRQIFGDDLASARQEEARSSLCRKVPTGSNDRPDHEKDELSILLAVKQIRRRNSTAVEVDARYT